MGNAIKIGGSSGGGYVASATAPTNLKMLWLDTSNGILKYYNTTSSSWVPIKSVWG